MARSGTPDQMHGMHEFATCFSTHIMHGYAMKDSWDARELSFAWHACLQ
jgi:hypothetical protein